MRSTVVEARPYQQRVVGKVMKAVEEGHKTIMIESPTGSGKTVMALSAIKQLREKYGYSVGWTCMRRVLLEQAQEENMAKFGMDFIKYFSTFSDDIPQVDILVEDEAQHSASDTSTTLYSKMNPKVHIAMTATPYRTDRMKLCFSKVIKDAGIRQLIDEGYLSQFQQFMVDLEWTPNNLSKVYLDNKDRWGKSVIFFLTKQRCYEFQRILADSNVECEVVEGGSLHKQEKQLERFANGEVPILANVFVLTEGFDAPDLKTVFIRPGSKGPTVQMGGRALRKHPDKPFSQMVQNSKTRFPFSAVASAQDKWVMENGIWVSRGSKHEQIFDVQKKVIHAIMNAKPPSMPKFITQKKAKAFKGNFRVQEAQRENEGAPRPDAELIEIRQDNEDIANQ